MSKSFYPLCIARGLNPPREKKVKKKAAAEDET